MENINVEFSNSNLEQLKKLIAEFQSYYNDDCNDEEVEQWSFQDVDNQRMIGVEIIDILNEVLTKK